MLILYFLLFCLPRFRVSVPYKNRVFFPFCYILLFSHTFKFDFSRVFYKSFVLSIWKFFRLSEANSYTNSSISSPSIYISFYVAKFCLSKSHKLYNVYFIYKFSVRTQLPFLYTKSTVSFSSINSFYSCFSTHKSNLPICLSRPPTCHNRCGGGEEGREHHGRARPLR